MDYPDNDRAEEEVSLFINKEVRDRARAEEKNMTTKKKIKKQIPRIVIFVEGGVLSFLCSDRKVQVMHIDYDVEGRDDYRTITHPDGREEDCTAHLTSVQTNSKLAAFYFKQLVQQDVRVVKP